MQEERAGGLCEGRGGVAELMHPHVMEIQYFHIYFYTYTQLSMTCSGRTVRHNYATIYGDKINIETRKYDMHCIGRTV